MSTTLPECARAAENLLEYAYGELVGQPLTAFEGHLSGCAHCQAELATLRATRKAMGGLGVESAPPAGLESLLAYAQKQAERPVEREAHPWRRWIFAVVPTAALAVIVFAIIPSHVPVLGPNAPASLGSMSTRAVGAQEEMEAPTPAPVAKAAEVDSLAGGGAPRDEQPVRAQHLSKDRKAPKPYSKALGASAHGSVGFKEAKRDEARRAAKTPAAVAQAAPPPSSVASALGDSPARSAAKKESPDRQNEARDQRMRQEPVVAAKGGGSAAARGLLDTGASDADLDKNAPAPPAAKAQSAGNSRWAEAEALARSGDHKGAARAYRALYEADHRSPRAAEALYLSAVELESAGDPLTASRTFDLVANAYPGSSYAAIARHQSSGLASRRAKAKQSPAYLYDDEVRAPAPAAAPAAEPARTR